MNLHLTKKEEEVKERPLKESPQSSSTSDHSYIKGSMFGDVALQSMLVPALEEIKNEEIKSSMITDDMKIKSQSELISILEEGNESKPDNTKLTDLNPMMSNNFEEKIDKKDDTKEDTLNTITGGLLSSGSIDLQLSQSDLERLSSLAQLSEVANAPPPNVPQPEAAIDSGDCRMNLLEHIDYFQNLVTEKLDLIENEISGILYYKLLLHLVFLAFKIIFLFYLYTVHGAY